ncbi:hypothetical protein A4S06_00065 [Erysipelotrichaceae bacterium MTC7]|nr:hypothetical protein A4S06_00065 [Erysipelotrichaceae bacterium MTC7]
MKLKKIILDVILSFFRLFLVFVKVDPKKITFVSLEHEHLAGDFRLLSRALEKENEKELDKYHLYYLLTKFEKTLWGNLQYFFICIKQLFVINSSALVILDYNNYVVSKFKRKEVKVLQLWHATGAIKQFGNVVDRDYTIANYDYVISNCEYFRKPYAEAFNINEDQVYVTGIPKTDRLFKKRKIEKDRKAMYKQFPEIKGKKVVLYAPTFRGRLMAGFRDGQVNLDKIIDALGDEYVILYKMHPLLTNRTIDTHSHVICCNGMSIKKLFSVTDVLISDYSAIIFDFSIFDKPMVFYVPDLDEYAKNPGLFVDYEKEMPGQICKSEDAVVAAIQAPDCYQKERKAFRNKFFAYQDGKSIKRVMALIDQIMGGEQS